MTTTIRSWLYDLNYAVLGGTQLLKYQDAMFRWKQNLKGIFPANLAGAWTPYRSSDSVSAANSDLWITAANIIPDAGGNAHSWIAMSSPAGMVPGGTIHMLWDAVDADTVDPSNYSVWVSTSPFTGGSNLVRASAPGEIQANSSSGVFMSDNNSLRRTHMLRTTIGEFILLSSLNGSNTVDSINMGLRPDNGEPLLPFPFMHLVISPGDVMKWLFLGNAVFTTIYNAGGIPTTSYGRMISIAEHMTSWVGGVSQGAPARAADAFIDVVGNGVGWNQYTGRVIDVRGAPDLLPPNSDQQGDTPGAGVTVGAKRISVNGLWVPLTTPFTINL